tara:strand:+ start:43193 stop:43666 length:474 start_codon:yes stop_codon:yes gene_type:complete
MKRVLTAFWVAMASPAAFAGSTGSHVPQVLPEPPAPTIGPIIVDLQHSETFKTQSPIAGVSVGSSQVANVTVHDANTILVTGRAYGSTSLHVIDNRGNIIVDTTIDVTNHTQTRLVVNRAGSDYTMHCAPNCEEKPDIGDNKIYFDILTDQAQQLSR